ncbi:MAG: hypothetical protein ACK5AY_10335, partial [Bacteroidota bacterium]
KNRIQYQDFEWTYMPFERFQIYVSDGGQEIGRYSSVFMQKNLEELEKKMDYQLEDKIQVLIYNNYHDFIQSNLGLATDEQGNLGGVTRIAGTKMSVYFNGTHADLDKQLRMGIAEILINQVLYGGRARDVVKNSTLLSVPDWFKYGLVSFYGEDWNFDLDSRTMDAIDNDLFLKFNQLSGKEAVVAGHAFWNYISETYGDAIIPNLLYMTKVSRNVENAFLFVLATPITQLTNEWIESYMRRTIHADTTQYLPSGDPAIKKVKRMTEYYNMRLSNDGNNLLYATSEQGQNKAWLLELNSGKKKRIYRSGPKLERIHDHSYPLLAWHPNGKVCGIITEIKNQIVLISYDLESKEKFFRNITGFEKITDFSYAPDGKKIIFSGVRNGKGQSDLFIFVLAGSGLEQLTNDIYDDVNVRFVNQGKQIVFASNRVSDTLNKSDDAKYYYYMQKETDIFMMDYPKRKNVLYRLTQSENINESQPQDFGNGYISYLSEANGIRNEVIARMDSVIAFVDTIEHYRYTFYPTIISNYKRNIESRDINLSHDKRVDVFYLKGKYETFIRSFSPGQVKSYNLINTYYRKLYNNILRERQEKITSEKNKLKNQLNDSTSEKSTNAKSPDDLNPFSPKNFRSPLQKNYYTNFSVDYVVSQLDNSFLSVQYQRFNGGGSPIYINPGLNALFKIGLSDLFEDYRIVAGLRFSAGMDNEYLLSWENRKKLWDKQVILHRQSFVNVPGGLSRVLTHDVQYKIKYPFSEVFSVRFSALLRNDKRVYLATNQENLANPSEFDNMAGIKMEWVLDNTIKKGINLYNGFRGKIFSEYYRFIANDRRDLITYGFDMRHYQKIHRDIIWANRLAGAGSLGTDRLIYYLGGVDNWFRPRFDNSINIVRPDQYTFQTLATPLRGFSQNIRNGNNFIVFNSEIRVPVFRYLLNKPIRTEFFNNFQLVFFGDIGSAWYSWNPYSEENTLNTNVYGSTGNPVQVTLFKQKEPIVGGTGWGLRTRVFGYFLRLDFSWGIDDRVVRKGMTTLSFSTDF